MQNTVQLELFNEKHIYFYLSNGQLIVEFVDKYFRVDP
jgi:hypothetical protein